MKIIICALVTIFSFLSFPMSETHASEIKQSINLSIESDEMLQEILKSSELEDIVKYKNDKGISAQASSSTFVRRTASYNKDNYCEFRSCSKGKKPMPQQIWVTVSGGYAGYIPVEKSYISATHIVVTYAGNIPKAPYAPTLIDEEK